MSELLPIEQCTSVDLGTFGRRLVSALGTFKGTFQKGGYFLLDFWLLLFFFLWSLAFLPPQFEKPCIRTSDNLKSSDKINLTDNMYFYTQYPECTEWQQYVFCRRGSYMRGGYLHKPTPKKLTHYKALNRSKSRTILRKFEVDG